MRINSINFGMKFTPNTERLINAAKNDCITKKQEIECEKCINFLEKTFPEKTLDIKTEFYKPKNLWEKIMGKKGYYDKAYIDDRPAAWAKIQPFVCEEKIENERLFFVGGITLPTYDVCERYRKETHLERLIALSNAILITHFSDIHHFPFTTCKKFLGGN